MELTNLIKQGYNTFIQLKAKSKLQPKVLREELDKLIHDKKVKTELTELGTIYKNKNGL